MTTKTNDDVFAALRAPFPLEDLDFRFQSRGKQGGGLMLAYLDARAVMDRLDAAVGPDKWTHTLRCETAPFPTWEGPARDASKVPIEGTKIRDVQRVWVCQLEVTFPDGTHVVHEDVSDESDIEATKGGASGAIKRAAVHFGIGRYLYSLPDFYVPQEPERWPRWLPTVGTGRGQFPPTALPQGYRPPTASPAAPAPQTRPVEPPALSAQARPSQAVSGSSSQEIESLIARLGLPPCDVSGLVGFGMHKECTWLEMLKDDKKRGWLHWLEKAEVRDERDRATKRKVRDLIDWWAGTAKFKPFAAERSPQPSAPAEPSAAEMAAMWDDPPPSDSY